MTVRHYASYMDSVDVDTRVYAITARLERHAIFVSHLEVRNSVAIAVKLLTPEELTLGERLRISTEGRGGHDGGR